jgi:hypothetical protein
VLEDCSRTGESQFPFSFKFQPSHPHVAGINTKSQRSPPPIFINSGPSNPGQVDPIFNKTCRPRPNHMRPNARRKSRFAVGGGADCRPFGRQRAPRRTGWRHTAQFAFSQIVRPKRPLTPYFNRLVQCSRWPPPQSTTHVVRLLEPLHPWQLPRARRSCTPS